MSSYAFNRIQRTHHRPVCAPPSTCSTSPVTLRASVNRSRHRRSPSSQRSCPSVKGSSGSPLGCSRGADRWRRRSNADSRSVKNFALESTGKFPRFRESMVSATIDIDLLNQNSSRRAFVLVSALPCNTANVTPTRRRRSCEELVV
jgi:hypothetical protein